MEAVVIIQENQMRASASLVEKIKDFEGLSLKAYLDPTGVPTIGYGHTGKDVSMGDRISRYWAEDLLRRDLRKAEAVVKELGVAKTQGQFDALVSFAFNLGVDRLEKSTLLKRIRGGDGRKAITAADTLGLCRRQEAERAGRAQGLGGE